MKIGFNNDEITFGLAEISVFSCMQTRIEEMFGNIDL